MIKYIKGDLFLGKEDIIVHGCNCFCTFGAGIAYQLKKLYPEAFQIDQQTIKGDRLKLGTYTQWNGKHYLYPERNIIIINAYTQYYYANEGLKPFDYQAFLIILDKLKENFKDKTIAMPKIGAGLAGGDWKIIEKMINDVFEEKEIIIYIL